jgi:hypothetical protein
MLDINVAGLRDLMTSLGDLLDGPQRALAVIGRCNPSGDNSSEIIISTTSIRKWLSILQEVESFCISPQPPASGMKRREMSMAAHAEGADGTQQLEAVATVGPKRQRVRQRLTTGVQRAHAYAGSPSPAPVLERESPEGLDREGTMTDPEGTMTDQEGTMTDQDETALAASLVGEYASVIDLRNPKEVLAETRLTSPELQPTVRWLFLRAQALDRDSMPRERRALTSVRAEQMINMARKVGQKAAFQQLKLMWEHWREHTTLTQVDLFRRAVTASQEMALPHNVASQPKRIQDLYCTFHAMKKTSLDTLVNAIFHRRLLADFWRHYQWVAQNQDLINEVIPAAAATMVGCTNNYWAKEYVFRILHPQWAEQSDFARRHDTKAAWSSLLKQLAKGQRWDRVETMLGRGILGLMPESVFNHSWVERTMTNSQCIVWIELVQRINPAAVEYGKRIAGHLHDALSGKPVPPEVLVLERTLLKDIRGEEDGQDLLGLLLEDMSEASPLCI